MTVPVVLISEEEIQSRVLELAAEISSEYGNKGEIVLVGVLKGSFIFLADLSRRLSIPRTIEFIAVSSYGNGSKSSGAVRLVRTCALVRKAERAEVEVKVDYLGFDIGDEWVVGYGLDYAEQNRTLPYIGVISPDDQ